MARTDGGAKERTAHTQSLVGGMRGQLDRVQCTQCYKVRHEAAPDSVQFQRNAGHAGPEAAVRDPARINHPVPALRNDGESILDVLDAWR